MASVATGGAALPGLDAFGAAAAGLAAAAADLDTQSCESRPCSGPFLDRRKGLVILVFGNASRIVNVDTSLKYRDPMTQVGCSNPSSTLVLGSHKKSDLDVSIDQLWVFS